MTAFLKNRCLSRWLLVLVTTTLLASCGFQLRGNVDFSFDSIYIDFPGNSQTARLLKRLIKAMDSTQIVSKAQEAEVILAALSETKNKEVLSLNTDGRVREYSLIYTLEFMARTPEGKVLIPPTRISLRRTMTYNDSEALSKENEEIMLFKDMQSDMAQQILRRLAAIRLTPEDLEPEPVTAPTTDVPAVRQPEPAA